MPDYFPPDLCRVILLHLPARSLLRFTAVSKSWKSLITSHDFIYEHLSNSNAKTGSLVYGNYDTGTDTSLPLFAVSNGINPCYELQFPNKFRVLFLRVVGSSDGLVCFTDAYSYSYGCSSHSIIVSNPSVRNHVVLPHPLIVPGKSHIAIGFGVADGVYKVVRMVSGEHNRPRAEVYSLGSGRWRRVEGFHIKFQLIQHQFLLKRFMHWLSYKWSDNYISSRTLMILSFEIGDEVFGEVALPDVLEEWEEVRLSSVEGSLALVKFSGYHSYHYDVWVMKEYGVKESWTKFYSIDLAERLHRVVGFKNGEAILVCESRELVSYNLETKKTNNIGIQGIYPSFHIDDYVESLLLLKGNCLPALEEVDFR